jgi:subtilase family serine protease
LGAQGSPVAKVGGAATSVPSVSIHPGVEFNLVPKVAAGGAYDPAQLHANYGMNALYKAGLTGKGTTIGIVDAYGSPTIAKDLVSFDKEWGVAAPPSFKIVQPAGKVTWTDSPAQQAWAVETSLDVEYAHAMAPGASLVLAETPVNEIEGTTGFAQIVTAEKAIIDTYHVDVISQSFEATENTFPSVSSIDSFRSAYTLAQQKGVSVIGASGDAGASGGTNNPNLYYAERVVGWPASDPLVTAVGGTDIFLNSAGGQTSPPVVWNQSNGASGGGLSIAFGRPSWQDGVRSVVGTHRGLPDVSLVGGPPGVYVYWSFQGHGGVGQVWGTSLATPLFAGVIALADQLHGGPLGLLNPMLYKLGAGKAKGFVDITAGNNTVTLPTPKGANTTITGFNAGAGYDLASGWGTINAAYLVPELAGKPLP